jgi:glutathione S-transferase
MTDLPVLWHIEISHYNEKARWALDYKGIPHRRRAPMPGLGHMPRAFRLTRRFTFPVLELEGRAIGDSTRIIEALERHRPDPPLYPAGPAERRRALDLEEFFDTELGPHIRAFAFQHLLEDREQVVNLLARDNRRVARALDPGYPVLRRVFRARYGVSESAADRGLAKTRAALDRIEAERGGRDHLVGDRFTVADLTAAALLAPLLQPPEFPHLIGRLPASLEPIRAELLAHPASEWAYSVYRRYRGSSAEVAAVA